MDFFISIICFVFLFFLLLSNSESEAFWMEKMVQHKQDRIQQATTSKAEWNSGDGSWQMGWSRVLPLDLHKKINVVKTVRSY